MGLTVTVYKQIIKGCPENGERHEQHFVDGAPEVSMSYSTAWAMMKEPLAAIGVDIQDMDALTDEQARMLREWYGRYMANHYYDLSEHERTRFTQIVEVIDWMLEHNEHGDLIVGWA